MIGIGRISRSESSISPLWVKVKNLFESVPGGQHLPSSGDREPKIRALSYSLRCPSRVFSSSCSGKKKGEREIAMNDV